MKRPLTTRPSGKRVVVRNRITSKPSENPSQRARKPRARVHAKESGLSALDSTMTVSMENNGRVMMEALARAFPPEALVAKYVELLNADVQWVNKKGKVSKRPDNAVRLRALDMLTVTLVGKPIERVQTIAVTKPTTFDDLIGRAQKSAVFRESLIEMLEKLSSKPQPVEVSSPCTVSTYPGDFETG